jgi:hypothetical protein
VISRYDDEGAIALLKECHEAGRLLLVENVMPEVMGAFDYPAYGISDVGLLLTSGGRERTEAEFRDILAAAGFEIVSISANPAGGQLIEARPLA